MTDIDPRDCKDGWADTEDDLRRNPNQRFAELAGICWHDPVFTSIGTDPIEIKHRCVKCHKIVGFHNPDFSDEPWLVLEVMSKRKDWLEFLDEVGEAYNWPKDGPDARDMIRVDYILDRTGKLRDAAIEWMERRKG